MSIARSLCGLISLLLSTTPSFAQLPPGRDSQAPTEVTLITESDLVRFMTPGTAVEWRLEVLDAQNQPIFDSGLVSGKTLDWPLMDGQGQPIESGLYSYTLTIHRGASEARIQRGQLQIERTRSVYQISALSSDAPSGGVVLTVMDAAGSKGELAGTSEPVIPTRSRTSEPLRRGLSTVSFAPQPLISGSGTTSSMTKWIDGPSGVVGDTNVTEVNGSVVVGNGTFRGNLHIFGGATDDVFAGMGPNLITGPGFNYGYAGSSFGRSAGFFNVRPDASAVAPNPSLRFMTANVERMIIANSGNVGIGVTSPIRRLQVVNTDGRSGTIHVGSNNLWMTGERRYVSFGDTGCSFPTPIECVYVGEEDGDDRLVFAASAFRFKRGDVLPEEDGGQSLGGPSNRWDTVYAVNGTINTSDARLKQDIRNLDNGLASVLKLRPVSFAWKNGNDTRRHLGLLAQEVDPVIPEAVYRDSRPDVPLGMNYDSLIPVLIKAIQELQAENAALQKRHDDVAARLAALEQQLRRR